MATVMIAPPTIGSALYLPVCTVIRPAISEVMVAPSIIGISSRPLTVGEACCTVCWYSGRNVIAPNIARPSRKLMLLASEKLRFLNTCIGRIGSTALFSTQMNAATDAIASAISDMIVGEPQAYWLPPQVVTSTIAVAPTARIGRAQVVDLVRDLVLAGRCSVAMM